MMQILDDITNLAIVVGET